MTENENNFLDFLEYRNSQNNSFFKKIPEFEDKIADMNFKLGLKESMIRVRQNFEVQRRKATYKTIVDELNDIIKKSKNKKKKE